MIDLHSHVLPGVDDGSRSIAQSVDVLRAFEAAGVKHVVCTPHLEASHAADAPVAECRDRLAALRREAPSGVELSLGWEIMLDMPGVDLTGDSLRLGASNTVLVELPRGMIPPGIAAELFRIRASGVVPLVAHPERYAGLTVEQVAEWRRAGALMQVGVQSLRGQGRSGPLARAILGAGLADILASDNHGDVRSLAQGAEWLREVATPEHVELLTAENPARILAGHPPRPVPPIVSRRHGLFGRISAMFTRSRTIQ